MQLGFRTNSESGARIAATSALPLFSVPVGVGDRRVLRLLGVLPFLGVGVGLLLVRAFLLCGSTGVSGKVINHQYILPRQKFVHTKPSPKRV